MAELAAAAVDTTGVIEMFRERSGCKRAKAGKGRRLMADLELGMMMLVTAAAAVVLTDEGHLAVILSELFERSACFAMLYQAVYR